MTKRELELVARLIYRTKTGMNMPNRAPLDDFEAGALDRHCGAALGGLNEQARAMEWPEIEVAE